MGPPAGLVDEDSKAAVKYKEYIAVRMCGGSPSGEAHKGLNLPKRFTNLLSGSISLILN